MAIRFQLRRDGKGDRTDWKVHLEPGETGALAATAISKEIRKHRLDVETAVPIAGYFSVANGWVVFFRVGGKLKMRDYVYGIFLDKEAFGSEGGEPYGILAAAATGGWAKPLEPVVEAVAAGEEPFFCRVPVNPGNDRGYLASARAHFLAWRGRASSKEYCSIRIPGFGTAEMSPFDLDVSRMFVSHEDLVERSDAQAGADDEARSRDQPGSRPQAPADYRALVDRIDELEAQVRKLMIRPSAVAGEGSAPVKPSVTAPDRTGVHEHGAREEDAQKVIVQLEAISRRLDRAEGQAKPADHRRGLWTYLVVGVLFMVLVGGAFWGSRELKKQMADDREMMQKQIRDANVDKIRLQVNDKADVTSVTTALNGKLSTADLLVEGRKAGLLTRDNFDTKADPGGRTSQLTGTGLPPEFVRLLNGKADLTSMTTALDGKLSTTDLLAKGRTAGLLTIDNFGTRPDPTGKTSQLDGTGLPPEFVRLLNGKADLTGVTTALDGKVSTSELLAKGREAGLLTIDNFGTKPSQTGKTSQLAGTGLPPEFVRLFNDKADLTSVTAALDGKVSTAELLAKGRKAGLLTGDNFDTRADPAGRTSQLAGTGLPSEFVRLFNDKIDKPATEGFLKIDALLAIMETGRLNVEKFAAFLPSVKDGKTRQRDFKGWLMVHPEVKELGRVSDGNEKDVEDLKAKLAKLKLDLEPGDPVFLIAGYADGKDNVDNLEFAKQRAEAARKKLAEATEIDFSKSYVVPLGATSDFGTSPKTNRMVIVYKCDEPPPTP